MRIGIFDSGLGGLLIAKAIFSAGSGKLSTYDYIYFGDTKNLPYGQKTKTQIYNFTKNAVDYLFKADCKLVILACNTASALALRKIQKEYLPKYYPNRKVLGVIVPTLEAADDNHKRKKIGVLATTATVRSHIYKKELKKIDTRADVREIAAPKLVEYIEKDALPEAENALKLYLKPLNNIEALVLGCTHYPILKREVRGLMGKKVAIVSQDEIIPKKLANYLKRHPEIERSLGRKSKKQFFVTALNKNFALVAKRLFGKNLDLKKVDL